MRTRGFAIVTVVATAACSGGSEYRPTYSNEQIVAPAPAEPGSYVLVARNAWLYTASAEDAEHARAFPDPSDPGSPIVYRVVREVPGGWTKIETIDGQGDDIHCESGNYSLRDLRLRFFVHSADLSATTTREVTTRFADGTAITLAAGVPLVPTGRSTPQGLPIYTAYADYVFNTWVQPDAVGRRYDPTRHFELPETSDVVSRTARLVFGQTGELRARENRLHGAQFVYGRRDVGSNAVVTLRTRCAQFEVMTEATNVTHFPGYLGMLGGSNDTLRGTIARANARICWANGRPAGSVRRDVSLDAEVEAIDGRRCFRKSLRLGPRASEPGDHLLRLCFDPADIGVAAAGDAAAGAAVDASVGDVGAVDGRS